MSDYFGTSFLKQWGLFNVQESSNGDILYSRYSLLHKCKWQIIISLKLFFGPWPKLFEPSDYLKYTIVCFMCKMASELTAGQLFDHRVREEVSRRGGEPPTPTDKAPFWMAVSTSLEKKYPGEAFPSKYVFGAYFILLGQIRP